MSTNNKIDTGTLEGGGERQPAQGTNGYECYCPKCGYKTEKVAGIECQSKKCPKCGIKLMKRKKKSLTDFCMPDSVFKSLKTKI